VNGELNIVVTGRESHLDLSITDLGGQVVYSDKISATPSGFNRKINMSGFAKGVYFLRLTTADRSYSEKVVVR